MVSTDDDSDLETPFPVPDIYSDGVAAVHLLGNENFRTVFFTWVRDPPTGIYTRVVVARIVRPKSSIPPGGNIAKRLAKARHMRPPNHRNRLLDGH